LPPVFLRIAQKGPKPEKNLTLHSCLSSVTGRTRASKFNALRAAPFSHLLICGEIAEEFGLDGCLASNWTTLLVCCFRRTSKARALDDALEHSQCPRLSLRAKRIPRRLPEYGCWGDEREAIWCAAENMKTWETTNGAIAWVGARINAARPALLN
jgi:hypothetical protein